jgi:septum formation protein
MSHPPAAAPVLCLASASPRRRELLRQIGVPHTIAAAGVDETPLAGESARQYVARLARAKALAVRSRGETLPVLAADTAVVMDERLYGKPADRAEALAMLGGLSGRTHTVLTAVALATARDVMSQVSDSAVSFRAIAPEEMSAYWDTGEPRDKAGGYAIQGYGAIFVEALAGSYSGVMGLPLYETAQLLRAAAIPLWVGTPP